MATISRVLRHAPPRLRHQTTRELTRYTKTTAASKATRLPTRRLSQSAKPVATPSVRFVGRHRAEITADDGTRTVDTRTLSQRGDLATWLACRQALDATASEFSCAAFDASPFASRAALLESKVFPARRSLHVDTPATRFGRTQEPVAVAQYAAERGHAVSATGLWTDESLAFGASPDGIVVDGDTGETGLLEVKCYYSRRRQRFFPPFARPPGRFFAQIQGGLAVCDLEWCDLVCWIPKNSHRPNYSVVRVHRDRQYWERCLKPKLDAFADELRRRRGDL